MPADQAGAASAISETAYKLAAVLGTAILGGILSELLRSGGGAGRAEPGAGRERDRNPRRCDGRRTIAAGRAVREPAGIGPARLESGMGITSLIAAAVTIAAAAMVLATLRDAR